MLISEWLYEDDAIVTLVRNRLLMDLVTKGEGKKPIPKERLSRLNVHSSFAFPTLAVFEPSGFGRGKRERRGYAERIEDFLRRDGAEGYDVFLDEEGRVGLLFSWESKEAVEGIHARLRERFEHPINAGVGLPCGKLADAHVSYRQALLALEARFYKGVGQIVYYNEMGSYRRLGEYPVAKEKELFERIKGEDDGISIEEAVERFYDYLLEDGPLDRRNIDESTIRLLIGLEKRAFAEAYDDSAYRSYSGYDILSIVQMETLREIKEHVSAQLIRLREWMMPARPESRHTIIKKTLDYLQQDFEFATLDNTARKVHMTPTYLSALFKNSTGKTFIEQLTDIRIEKAKDMLRGTHLKNYEVAERVGYKDSRYFSQIFKKKVGLSPSEYRDMAVR
ncbi:helix-turn-helix domain-containing protein [Cohnella thailandensis]|uniref:Helix-turn-helix transcriptional regulator n=1 Tax=Cohnella thailandensis TaxID=557557 RepID=A0A841T409_9BACL|nr:helix-turn-helix domain-containing protein [Cohnella thailandensis]MBB6636597.1 helix-turn-helix transcriptional regulator [Cohnella thailandensis]MBP1973529.1 AraC-like DNA-binding protein [Cohnella thailandensis]